MKNNNKKENTVISCTIDNNCIVLSNELKEKFNQLRENLDNDFYIDETDNEFSRDELLNIDELYDDVELEDVKQK